MSSSSLQQNKLLLVDDSPINLDLLVSSLGKNYDLRTAISGETALDLLAEGFSPDLILLDIMMPKMDGYEVCQRLKADKSTQHIPIIFLTSLDNEDDEAKGLGLGAADYITKPFNPAIMRQRVQNQIELKQYRDQLQQLVDKKVLELESVKKKEQEKETFLKGILQAAPVAIGFIVDRKMVWINQRTAEISGYSCAELEGQQTRMLYPSTEVDRKVAEEYSGIQKTGKGSFDTVWQKKSGVVIDVHVNAAALDKSNLAAGVIFTVLDITKLKQAEEALRLSEDKFYQIFALSPNAITLSRLSDGTFLEVNQGFTDFLGWTLQEVIGRSALDLNIWCSVGQREEFTSRLLNNAEVDNVEIPFQHKDGRMVLGLSSSRLLKINGEECILNVVSDLTEREKTVDKIIKAKEEWEATFDAMSDMITIHDKNMVIVRANKAAHHFFDADYGTLNGKKCCEAFWGSDTTCPGCPLLITMKNREQCSEILSYNNSTSKTLLVTTVPIPVEKGRPEYYIHIARDITEQRQLEKEANRVNRLASLGELAAGIAHEINNPNALILYNSDILDVVLKDLLRFLEENPPANPEQLFGGLSYHEVAQEIPVLLPTIRDSAGRIKRIVNDLRDFSRQDSSAIDEFIDVNQVVQAAERLVRNAIRTATDHFAMNLAEILPAVTGVTGRLEQVVINLLLNACQALENRSQKLSVITAYDADLEQIQIIITDEGQGMTVDVLEHILEPFVTSKRDQGGTGLGLSVSARIVKEHQGTLKFNSAFGEGTTATVCLPVYKEDKHVS